MKNTKILIAVDSFKGSLSSSNAAKIISKGFLKINPNLEIKTVAIADGGEGTVEAFIENFGGKYVSAYVSNPLKKRIRAKFGLIENEKTAIIEMSAASGINLILPEERNPLFSSTFGTGELILKALKNNVNKIILGIGGSATNDGGIGLASALGIKFLNKNNKQIGINAEVLSELEFINIQDRNKLIKSVQLIVLSDVTNPLLGQNGASFVYAKQKGATNDTIKILEENLKNLVRVVKKDLNLHIESLPCTGAGGGLTYGLVTFFNAKTVNGIEFLINQLNLDEVIKQFDYVITGEGKMDIQTTYNKAPWGIMKIAKKYDKKIIGIAGKIEDNEEKILSKNFNYLYSMVNSKVSYNESIKHPKAILNKLSQKIAKELFC
ncbi:MAG: glycerate kinase [Ignavibacteriae bacterium]|nr:glycerate kinase [Ignavibacteriota bacterium]